MKRRTLLFLNKVIYNAKLKFDELSGSSNTEGLVEVVDELPDEYLEYVDKQFWLNPIGRYTLFVSNEETSEQANKLLELIETLKSIVEPFLKVMLQVNEYMSKDREGIRPLTDISIIIDVSDNKSLCFILHDIKTEEEFYNQLQKIIEISPDIYNESSELRRQSESAFKPDDRTSFLLYNSQTNRWEVVNILSEIGREKMLRVASGLDSRLSKPDMIVKETDIRREITLPTNWQIVGSERGYIMNRPNDMAMYMSIADKAFTRAEAKYKELHERGITHNIISDSVTSELLDYFEEIIQAIIMSYTSIECMSNTCIPWGGKYVTESGGIRTEYDKGAIERKFTLRDKLKKIIPQLLEIDSPVNEGWWQTFIDLEDLRNEIIHNKNSTAQNRYSSLIDNSVFKLAQCHREVITHYAEKLKTKHSFLINDFPIGIGHDEIMASLMSETDFDSFHRSLFNWS